MENLTFSVSGYNTSATQFKVKARGFELLIDEPESLGGTDEGANPVEFTLASFAGCLNVVGHIVAKELGITIHKLSIEVEGDINPKRFLGTSYDERAGFKSLRLKIKPETDATPEQLENWLNIVENRCPVRDTISGFTPIAVKLEKAEEIPA